MTAVDTAKLLEGALLDRIREGLIGEGAVLDGPYGARRITYADYTASGRSLSFIEDYLRAHVLPLYANTHTESSATGRQMSRLREEARVIIRDAVGGSADHLVIFCGSGSTAAVNKLVGILELRVPAGLDDRYGVSSRIPTVERPIVFVGPYEHHSNELPWRESIADVVEIGTDDGGCIDLAELEAKLQEYAARPLRIGSFSAGSNVTGILTDTERISWLLHRHGALSFWDYAAAGPYCPIRVTESEPGRGDGKDAVFLSPHKFVGGPQTPGVLVVRRDLLQNRTPTAPGGGTVRFVNDRSHDYVSDAVAREEGGTPAIVESVRAGLVFALKQAVGTDLIESREHELRQYAERWWSRNSRIELLGDRSGSARLSIMSFLIRVGDLYLHHNYVVALLNDLFGIQARGGCSCAGPYGHRLLGVGRIRSRAFRDAIAGGCDGVKPGWTRINFNYFISTTVRDYLVEAVDLVASYGHRLLDDYTFDPDSGIWQHRETPLTNLGKLTDVRFHGNGLTCPPPPDEASERELRGYLDTARRLFEERPDQIRAGANSLPQTAEALRWFHLPPHAC